MAFRVIHDEAVKIGVCAIQNGASSVPVFGLQVWNIRMFAL
jgi:hypothetical protein